MLRRVVRKVRSSLGYFIGLGIALIVGGATTALVMAAIPDSSGVIHGCRSNISGGLRVIDSASQQCLVAETAINWNQTGPQGPAGATGPQGPAGSGELTAYFQVNSDDSVVTSSLRNITSYLWNDGSTGPKGYCLVVSFTPKTGFSRTFSNQSGLYIRGLSSAEDEEMDSHCSSQYNAFIVDQTEAYQALLFN